MPTSTRFQCGHCLHILGLPDNLVGRKIRCPMCGDPLTIPPPDPQRSFQRQNLAVAIAKFELSDWDRAFALKVLERRKVDEKTLYKAIISIVKTAKKGAGTGLGEELKTAGALDEAECDLIRSLVRGTITDEKEAFAECPNCFASISGKARACKFCGQAMGDISVAICPNCKHEQPNTLPRCRRCMADMKTGLRTGVEACPGCNRPLMGAPEVCPHCKAKLREPTRRVRARERNQLVFRAKIAAAAMAGLAILILLFSGPLRTALRSLTVGYAQASLENRIRAFSDALQDNALEAIERCVDPQAALTVERDTRTEILLGTAFQERVSRVSAIVTADPELSATQDAAQVRVQATVLLTGREVGDDTRNVFGRGRSHRAEVVWRWVRRQGTWYFTPQETAAPPD